MKHVPSANTAVANTIRNDTSINNYDHARNIPNFIIGLNGLRYLSDSLRKGVFLFDVDKLFFHYNFIDPITASIKIIIDNQSIYNMSLDVNLAQFEEYLYFLQYASFRKKKFDL
jgi:hypothetical protein